MPLMVRVATADACSARTDDRPGQSESRESRLRAFRIQAATGWAGLSLAAARWTILTRAIDLPAM